MPMISIVGNNMKILNDECTKINIKDILTD